MCGRVGAFLRGGQEAIGEGAAFIAVEALGLKGSSGKAEAGHHGARSELLKSPGEATVKIQPQSQQRLQHIGATKDRAGVE